MGRLIVFDTSNFTDFPIGGQLTSERSFLRYLAEFCPETEGHVLLVGAGKREEETGTYGTVEISGRKFPVFYVCHVETDLGHTKHSLRASFAKGILKYGRALHITKDDLLYIQTPEAAGASKLLCPRAGFVVFSHGSYANMERGFRFYRKSIVKKLFLRYLHWVLRHAKLIFILDENSRRDYLPYNRNLVKVKNSIALPEDYESFDPEKRSFRGRLLFVGRLSKDKGLAGILKAAAQMEVEGITLTVVGDGEEGEYFRTFADEKIRFTGAVAPSRVASYMQNADVLVMNSDFEGVPMTILEALSHGLPVISTDVGGIAETVDFGKDAVRTDGTPESIIRAVREIKDHYADFAAAAHEHARQYDYRTVNGEVFDDLRKFWRIL